MELKVVIIGCMDTNQKGDITELEVLTYMTKLNYQVSIPFGDRDRYDQIWDIDGNLLRIQVKTSHPNGVKGETFTFSCSSVINKTKRKPQYRKYTKDEIDYFATYWNNKCYLVPVEECGFEKTLRLEEPKNNQVKGVSFAKDYEVEKMIDRIKTKSYGELN